MESNLIRVLAVLALAAALIVAFYITVNSGIMSGDDETAASDTETSTVVDLEAGDTSTGEAPAEPGAETQNTYQVKPGDSFASIAVEYDTSIARIVELNPNVNPQNLKPGTAIIVP